MPKPYVPNDQWSQRAAAEGYRARSVYKLMELDEKFRLIKTGMKVLDIGAAPGSWLQYASKRVGPTGKILGLDLKEIVKVAPNVITRVCDVLDPAAVSEALKLIGTDKVDLVLSDIAPNTSGIKDRDQWLSVELNRQVAAVASKVLKPNGALILKVFRGKDFDPFFADLRRAFGKVRVVSVAASRDRSREVYLVVSGR